MMTLKRLLLLALFLGSLAPLALAADSAKDASAAAGTPELIKGLPQGVYALFQSNHGDWVCQLLTDKAPLATSNFIGLAEGTKEYTDPRDGQTHKQPYYDGTVFHRIIAGFMIQGGDPTGTGRGGPGYMFRNEVSPELRHDKPGVLAMANAGPDTNGSQFYITVAPQPSLDGGYTIFGQVVRGMSVVDEISKAPVAGDPQAPRPVQAVTLNHVKIYRVAAGGKVAGDASATTATKKAEPAKKAGKKSKH